MQPQGAEKERPEAHCLDFHVGKNVHAFEGADRRTDVESRPCDTRHVYPEVHFLAEALLSRRCAYCRYNIVFITSIMLPLETCLYLHVVARDADALPSQGKAIAPLLEYTYVNNHLQNNVFFVIVAQCSLLLCCCQRHSSITNAGVMQP